MRRVVTFMTFSTTHFLLTCDFTFYELVSRLNADWMHGSMLVYCYSCFFVIYLLSAHLFQQFNCHSVCCTSFDTQSEVFILSSSINDIFLSIFRQVSIHVASDQIDNVFVGPFWSLGALGAHTLEDDIVDVS